MHALDESGLRNSTNVVLFGDHGYCLGEHGEWTKFANWELDTRVPLILRAPGSQNEPSRNDDHIVELVDVMPTVLDLVGVASPAGVQGVSLTPLLRGETWSPKPALSQWARREECVTTLNTTLCHDGLGDPTGAWMGYTIRTPDWRFTEWVAFDWAADPPRPMWETVNSAELYSHKCAREFGCLFLECVR